MSDMLNVSMAETQTDDNLPCLAKYSASHAIRRHVDLNIRPPLWKT